MTRRGGFRQAAVAVTAAITAVVGAVPAASAGTAATSGRQMTATTGVRAAPPATLAAGQRLLSGAQLVSANGFARLILQTDGNLVASAGGQPIFATRTGGHPGTTTVLQTD